MPKSSVSFSIKPFPANALALKRVRQIKERAQTAANQSALSQALELKEEILRRIPSTEAYSKYRSSLKVVEVVIGKQRSAMVLLDVEKVSEDEVNKGLTAVYVLPTKEGSKLQLIAENNPWPLEWLPYKPIASEAAVVSRMVREDEMERIKKRVDRVFQQVVTRLKEYGIEVEVAKKRKLFLTVDTAWEALRAEFGLDGQNEVPVWRPALRAVLARRGYEEQFMRALDRDLPITSEDVVEMSRANETARFEETLSSAVRGG